MQVATPQVSLAMRLEAATVDDASSSAAIHSCGRWRPSCANRGRTPPAA